MMKHFAILLLLIGALAIPEYSEAQEARCGELGANCICASTLNAPGPIHQSDVNYVWYVDDNVTKRCKVENVGNGGPITRNLANMSTVEQSNDSTILAALPSGHAVSYVHRGLDGVSSLWSVGHRYDNATVTKVRRSMRAYVYVSPNFQYTVPSANGTCAGNSGKLTSFQLDLGPYWSPSGASNWAGPTNWGAGWSGHNASCCTNAPGRDAAAMTYLAPNLVWGKWIRIEMVVTNEGGTPVVLKEYWKNVTDNTAEYLMGDTSQTNAEWSASNAANLTETGTQGRMGIEMFRTGSCPGYFAVSHVLYAAWDTDAGQRIGAASEIEGSGGGSTYSGGISGGFRMQGVMTIR